MKKGIKHLIIGTLICMSTMLLFLIFYKRLPENVPIQIKIDGSAGNTLSKPLFVFGLPIIFTVINLIKGLSLVKSQETPTYNFYIIPAISFFISVAILITALIF